jgi:hypothetical protein
MTFIAYVFGDPDRIPYMEPIAREDLVLAVAELERILGQHSRALFGELWEGDERILRMEPNGKVI